MGVARLAMHVDKNIDDKSAIIKEINISNEYKPNLNNMDVLLKRYEIWKDLYTSNKKIAYKLLH